MRSERASCKRWQKKPVNLQCRSAAEKGQAAKSVTLAQPLPEKDSKHLSVVSLSVWQHFPTLTVMIFSHPHLIDVLWCSLCTKLHIFSHLCNNPWKSVIKYLQKSRSQGQSEISFDLDPTSCRSLKFKKTKESVLYSVLIKLFHQRRLHFIIKVTRELRLTVLRSFTCKSTNNTV